VSDDLGFSFKLRKSSEVVITHRGRQATVLRGDAAHDFVQDMRDASVEDQQQEMARITGNYKRGNERLARNHPRNA